MHRIYLSLGSNLGDREKYLSSAICSVGLKIGKVIRVSGIYETESWGFETSDKFLNMAIELETEMSPEEVLRNCLSIEAALGRHRKDGMGYSSRTIDIDVLFYENLIFSTHELILPHPHMQNRNFILEPLDEIAPAFVHPILKTSINDLLTNCTDKGLVTYIGSLPSYS